MTKYLLQGLDCASCANEIEKALQKVEGLSAVQVNFATQSVVLDPQWVGRAQTVIDAVEPGVVLVSAQRQGEPKPDSHEGRAHALRLAATLVLLAFGLFSPWGANAALLAAYVLVGYPVLWSAARNIARGQVFNEMFLMSLATVGALAIGQWPEAVGVMLFYSVGEYLQDRAVARSRTSIAGLLNLRPDFARVLVDGSAQTRAPEGVAVGDLVEVLPGERVPLDGEVVEGQSFVDTASLTGESVPRQVSPGSLVLSGFVNDHGRLLVRVTRPFGQSSAARILDLVENAAAHKAPTEKFITRFAAYYTPAIVLISALVAVVPPLVFPGATFQEWIYRALVILVISCPCALVLSIPLGYFGGLGGASRNKLLVKGAHFLDALTRVDTVVFDKTGTLTQGVFAVAEVRPRNGFTREQLLGWAAAAESRSAHPIARSIREACPGASPVASDVSEVKGHGVIAVVGGQTVVAGNDRLLHREAIDHEDCDVAGTVVFVAVDGAYAGYLVVSDRVKDEAVQTVAELRRQGVRRLVMLTGDDTSVAQRVADQLGLDACFAEQLPEDKVRNLEQLMQSAPAGRKVVFVGDGMNDAPVLVRADVGFAMGGLGSDAAIEAADVVVMDDHLARVPQALRLAAFTRRVVLQNIAFALAVKGLFVVAGALGAANMWEAVVADVGVSLLAVLNAMRTIRYAGRTL
jgi:Cd2+/Zn2+-exporting ATPase